MRLKKYNIEIVIFLLLTTTLMGQEPDSIWVSQNKKQISVNLFEKDFGMVQQGDKTIFKFELTNLSSEPLVIWHVSSSCDCTTPRWTKKPIKMNGDGFVKLKYDSSKKGVFKKSVFVYTNFDDKPIKLTIRGIVVAPKLDSNVMKQNTSFNSKIPQP